MANPVRPIGHEDRLSLVDHLDELRSRLIVCAVALGVAFGVCLWQNHALLKVINKPLVSQTRKQVSNGQGTIGQAVVGQQGVLKVAADARAALGVLATPGSGLSRGARVQLQPLIGSLEKDVAKIPRSPGGDNPVTLGVGEPFTNTITVALYFAALVSLPVILFELYGFVAPALLPNERRVATPLLAAVPFLFVIGVLFGYFIALPAATRFFVNFNTSEFTVLVQASQYYKFAVTVLVTMGVVFQVPVVILGATRAGLVTPRQLRKNRRYAIIACAAVAAFLPGDAITLVLETVPLYLLYEASILLASLVERSARRTSAGPALAYASPAASASDAGASEPTVQQMIDHTDPDLSR